METALKHRDVIVIGGGPAGMSAAVWCVDLGLKPVLIERDPELGGQMLWTHNPITNYLGAEAANGAELAGKFAHQVRNARIEMVTGSGATSVDLSARTVVVGETRWTADAIVLATGVRRRKLGITGEQEFRGRGLLVSGSRDRDLVKGKIVVIVGGGDAALENALILSEFARKVVVVHRREKFAARDEFVSRASDRPNVEFLFNSNMTRIYGGEAIEGVELEKVTGETSTIACEAVLIRIGVEPATEMFANQVELDERGYVVVDKELRTSAADVWAIGDVAAPNAMTIANAVGAGSVAAKNIANDG